jgi:hypothetical protein
MLCQTHSVLKHRVVVVALQVVKVLVVRRFKAGVKPVESGVVVHQVRHYWGRLPL